MNDPYFLPIRQGIEKECLQHGIHVTELFRIKSFQASQLTDDFDGLIIVGRFRPEAIQNAKEKIKKILSILTMHQMKRRLILLSLILK